MFIRHPVPWSCLIHLALYHLHKSQPDSKYFRAKEIIGVFELGWDYLRSQADRPAAWKGNIATLLSSTPKIFKSGLEDLGRTGFWRLVNITPPAPRNSRYPLQSLQAISADPIEDTPSPKPRPTLHPQDLSDGISGTAPLSIDPCQVDALKSDSFELQGDLTKLESPKDSDMPELKELVKGEIGISKSDLLYKDSSLGALSDNRSTASSDPVVSHIHDSTTQCIGTLMHPPLAPSDSTSMAHTPFVQPLSNPLSHPPSPKLQAGPTASLLRESVIQLRNPSNILRPDQVLSTVPKKRSRAPRKPAKPKPPKSTPEKGVVETHEQADSHPDIKHEKSSMEKTTLVGTEHIINTSGIEIKAETVQSEGSSPKPVVKKRKPQTPRNARGNRAAPITLPVNTPTDVLGATVHPNLANSNMEIENGLSELQQESAMGSIGLQNMEQVPFQEPPIVDKDAKATPPTVDKDVNVTPPIVDKDPKVTPPAVDKDAKTIIPAVDKDAKATIPTIRKPRKPRIPLLTVSNEFHLKSQLDMLTKLPPHILQFRRKLHTRSQRRLLGHKLFNLDAWMGRYIQQTQKGPTPVELPAMLRTRVRMSDGTWDTIAMPGEDPAAVLERYRIASVTTEIPYTNSMLSRICGNPMLRDTLTVFEPRNSPYTGKKLDPYIVRDYTMFPPKKATLEAIHSRGKAFPSASASIDLVYLHEMHVNAVNDMLSRVFWPGIDVSENLMFPDFSVVALYKRLVIGCAFMTPEGYITFLMVVPGWNGCGIASRMLSHLIQKAKVLYHDVSLHVSANNVAMLLYQKFGFKPEGFIVGFYLKYLPSDSGQCKNAVFLRLRIR
ncbi:hypothetical protein BASA50_006658 [Batrachochytrium salamandrivorans]|uniref:N-acetyltransferase domain-containing protein n=1 Tax=Batrachochytrium salamandrivorans TaxID=1357716 RepID=A0ABQ8F998_9FUNG|nr:hypothetical protein BASA60_002920 [Batrachochytrium salamandrivorans]KAH6594411.1 hypothetical protein BASA50_006658 [Batrachochytrium salamandrivorans]